VFDRLSGSIGFVFLEGLEIIEPFDEKQISDLLHDFEGIRDPSGPERVPNPIDLGFDVASDQ
jgi:hypothetical protein